MKTELYSLNVQMLKSVSMFELHKVITDDFLAGFARNLTNWKRLAPYFSLTEVDVDQITEYCPDENDQKYQALLHWKKHEGDTATYHTLLETLLLHGEMEEVAALLGRLGAGWLYKASRFLLIACSCNFMTTCSISHLQNLQHSAPASG